MLDTFLKVAHAQQVKEAANEEFEALLLKLPIEELREIERTGEIKLAWGEPIDGEPRSWLERFKGSPLLPQALALEEEDLKAQAANMQRNAAEDQMRQGMYQQMDQIRLQKKLLEVELMKQMNGMEGMNTTHTDPASQDGAAQLAPNQLGSEMPMIGKSAAVVDQWAREMARTDFQKEAKAQELIGLVDGLMKEASVVDYLSKAAPKAMEFARQAVPHITNFAKAHPGAVIGGGLGMAHGLLKEDGGIGSAIGEGAVGAAAGHGLQHAGQQVAAAHPEMVTRMRTAMQNYMPKQPPVEKTAFIGAALGALGGGLARGGLGQMAVNFVRQNPMKAMGATAGIASNFMSARKQGQGMGASLLSGAAGGLSSL